MTTVKNESHRHIQHIHGINKVKNQKFKVNPLDINLTRMQFNLMERCEREVPEHGDFVPVTEKYESKDRTRNLDEAKLVCRFKKDESSPKDDQRILESLFSDKTTKQVYSEVLFKGTKSEICEYLKNNELLGRCKTILTENNL